jgi:hemerythrin-like domain-containing protein
MGGRSLRIDLHHLILSRRTSTINPLRRVHRNAYIDTDNLQTSHSASYVATQMSLAHNGIIRGLNSIYLQAPNLPPQDKSTARDFLTYCQCWSESMHHHHDAEEKAFFPDIEAISGVEGLMETNVEQHRAFTPGFEAFEAYCRSCEPGEFDGQKLRSLVEGFAEPLVKHLHDEIGTLRGLGEYDSGRVREAYRRFEKLLMDTDTVGPFSLVRGTIHVETAANPSCLFFFLSNESRLWSLAPPTAISRMACMTFLLCLSLCRM